MYLRPRYAESTEDELIFDVFDVDIYLCKATRYHSGKILLAVCGPLVTKDLERIRRLIEDSVPQALQWIGIGGP